MALRLAGTEMFGLGININREQILEDFCDVR